LCLVALLRSLFLESQPSTIILEYPAGNYSIKKVS
jgi:hypothetical protein